MEKTAVQGFHQIFHRMAESNAGIVSQYTVNQSASRSCFKIQNIVKVDCMYAVDTFYGYLVFQD